MRQPDAPLRDPNQFIAPHAALLKNRYECLACLGEGGFGTVYKARRLVDGAVVAVKLLHPSKREGALSRFEREHRSLRGLTHPNIVTVGPGMFQGDAAWFEMDFHDGGNLAQKLRNPAWLAKSPASRLAALQELAHPVLLAMEHYHNKGVVHRDLKPENILFQDEAPVIADFGIATISEDRRDKTVFATAPGQVVGTVFYMAPEQLLGEEADIRADMYALGTIFYEMLTLALPFQDVDQRSIAYKYRKLIAEPNLDRLRACVPASWVHVIETTLKADPHHRYATPTELRAALEEAAEQTAEHTTAIVATREPVPTRPVEPVQQVQTPRPTGKATEGLEEHVETRQHLTRIASLVAIGLLLVLCLLLGALTELREVQRRLDEIQNALPANPAASGGPALR